MSSELHKLLSQAVSGPPDGNGVNLSKVELFRVGGYPAAQFIASLLVRKLESEGNKSESGRSRGTDH